MAWTFFGVNFGVILEWSLILIISVCMPLRHSVSLVQHPSFPSTPLNGAQSTQRGTQHEIIGVVMSPVKSTDVWSPYRTHMWSCCHGDDVTCSSWWHCDTAWAMRSDWLVLIMAPHVWPMGIQTFKRRLHASQSVTQMCQSCDAVLMSLSLCPMQSYGYMNWLMGGEWINDCMDR